MRVGRGLALLLAGTMLTGSVLADWSSHAVYVRWGSQFAEPANARDVHKTIAGYSYSAGVGDISRFANVEWLRSDADDPARNSRAGADEVYAVYRQHHWQSKGWALSWGLDAGTKNDAFAGAPRKLLAGVTHALPVSGGFAEVGLYAYKEWNYNGIVGRSVTFDPTWQLAAAWGVSVFDGAQWQGFAAVTGEKGRDGFGAPTAVESLVRTSLLWPLAEVAGGRLMAGPAVEWWQNKFGNQAGVGTENTVPMLWLEWRPGRT